MDKALEGLGETIKEVENNMLEAINSVPVKPLPQNNSKVILF